MNGAGDELFTGSGLADDQNAGSGWGNLLGHAVNFPHGVTFPDDVGQRRSCQAKDPLSKTFGRDSPSSRQASLA
jgi:hypothetical protein